MPRDSFTMQEVTPEIVAACRCQGRRVKKTLLFEIRRRIIGGDTPEPRRFIIRGDDMRGAMPVSRPGRLGAAIA